MSELDKLEQYLTEHNYNIVRQNNGVTYHGYPWQNQIIVIDDEGNRLWDAVSHYGSYGFERGLIEVMDGPEGLCSANDVRGYLTAADIIRALESRKEKINDG